jgi:hypothetical protein
MFGTNKKIRNKKKFISEEKLAILVEWNELVCNITDFSSSSEEEEEIDEGIHLTIVDSINNISVMRTSLIFDDAKKVFVQYKIELTKKLITYHKLLLDGKISTDEILRKSMLYIRILRRSMARYAVLENIKFLMEKFDEKDYMPWRHDEVFGIYEDNISECEAIEIYDYGKCGKVKGFTYEKYESFFPLD